MTKPPKARAVKPVKAWAVLVDGKIDLDTIYERKRVASEMQDHLIIRAGIQSITGPIRVEVRPVARGK